VKYECYAQNPGWWKDNNSGTSNSDCGAFISNADPANFSLDIVRCDGENTTKRGKLPGLKNPDITPDGEYVIEAIDELGNSSMEKIVENGDVVKTYSIDDARETRQWFTET
jgi:nicotinic acid phosphoribosyltransferase